MGSEEQGVRELCENAIHEAEQRARRYGWCKRTGAWVARDDMLGMHVQIFDAGGGVERVTIRLHPFAHAQLAAELRELAWDRVLRTRGELEDEGAPLVSVGEETTDTAAWYEQRQDERLVAAALLRPTLRSRNLGELEARLRVVAARVGGVALVDVVEEMRAPFPRWDARQVDLNAFHGRRGDVVGLAISADEAEVLILGLRDDGVAQVLRVDHDCGEAVLRARGVLRDDGSGHQLER